MKESEEKMSRRAVLVTLAEDGDRFRINLDDAECREPSSKIWERMVHITNKSFSVEMFENLLFDEKELADFGYYIMARLHAFRAMSEN